MAHFGMLGSARDIAAMSFRSSAYSGLDVGAKLLTTCSFRITLARGDLFFGVEKYRLGWKAQKPLRMGSAMRTRL
jgi:hypothetical protein